MMGLEEGDLAGTSQAAQEEHRKSLNVLKFSLLGSGSSGNAALIVTPEGKLLIDNGLSFRQLQERTGMLGENLEGLRAVFVTHEHSDHVRGLGTLCRKLRAPVFLTAPTHASLPTCVGELPCVQYFEAGETLRVGGMEVSSFSVTHDAADPVSFVVRFDGVQIGFATDLGCCTHVVHRALAGSHALVLESNFCPDALRTGGYPAQVKHRIRSRNGHLSNQDMASLLSALLHDGLNTVVLVHISENNNRPELARAIAFQAMAGHPAQLYLATQDAPTPLFEVRR